MVPHRSSRLAGPRDDAQHMRTGLCLFGLALTLRVAVVLLAEFDGLYGQDAFAYFDQAVAIAYRTPRGQLPPLDFFWPNGYPAVAALAMLLAGPTPVAAQFVSIVCGSAVAPLTYLTCRYLFPDRHPRAAIIAGLTVVVAAQPVLSSVVVMSDAAALFWAVLAVWSAVRAGAGTVSPASTVATGGAFGMAAVSRWVYLLLLPALLFWMLHARLDGRRRLQRLVPFCVAAAVVVLPQMALSTFRPEGLYTHSWLVGWHPGNAVRASFETLDGVIGYRLPAGLFYLLPGAHPSLLVPPLGLFAAWGAYSAWRSGARAAVVLLAVWVGSMFAFLAGIPYENLRFGLAMWPPVVCLAAVGADALWNHRRFAGLVRGAVALSLAGMLAWTGWSVARFVRRQHEARDIALQVERRLPPSATLLAFGLTLTARHYTELDVIELYHQDAPSLAALTGRPGPIFLLLDTGNIGTQWRGRTPHVNLRWLHDHTRLERLAEFPPYTLFESFRGRVRGQDD